MRRLAVPTALLLSPLTLIMLWVALRNPVSLSGWCYALALLLLVFGLLDLPPQALWRRRPERLPRWLALVGLGMILLTGSVRCALVGSGGGSPKTGSVRLERWPGGASARFVDRLVDERDVSYLGVETLPWIGWIDRYESVGLREGFARVYRQTHADYGTLPSPFVATLLHLQRADAFDVLLVYPSTAPVADARAATHETAVVFLHGYAGSYVFDCSLVARAAGKVGALTVCPATRFDGYWWEGDGAAIVERTLSELAQRGVKRFVLAGLSNGAIGVGRLGASVAARHGSKAPQLRGLLQLFGASRRAPTTLLPTLLLHAQSDRRVKLGAARNYAARAPQAQLVFVQGDHFVLAKHPERVLPHVERFLRRTLAPLSTSR